jgi:hypothetical protein
MLAESLRELQRMRPSPESRLSLRRRSGLPTLPLDLNLGTERMKRVRAMWIGCVRRFSAMGLQRRRGTAPSCRVSAAELVPQPVQKMQNSRIME